MHRCAALCCDNKNTDMRTVAQCIKKCSEETNQASSYIQREIAGYQGRLERCALDCQDNVRDKMTSSSSESDVERFRKMYEDCVMKCVDTHVHSLPKLTQKIKDNIKSKSYNTEFL